MIITRLTLFFALALGIVFDATAQDTAITYQGQLRQSGEPFTGTANLEFRLFDQLTSGGQVGSMQSRPNWPVEDGLFQVELDFGLAAFTEQVRFLEVRVNGSTLAPRQAIRPSPMALFALGGNEGPVGPTGPQGNPGPQGPQGPAGASPFEIVDETGTIRYLIQNQVFEFRPDFSELVGPRIVMGHSSNAASGLAAVVLGGGASDSANLATGNYSVISSGFGNVAAGPVSSVGGGQDNSANGSHSTVSGGSNGIAEGFRSVVGGGSNNRAGGQSSTVAGGSANTADGLASTISGGFNNYANGEGSNVGGGGRNAATGAASTVVGGERNCAGGGYSWAGGLQAKVRPDPSGAFGACSSVPVTVNGDTGTFVWADSQGADLVSTGADQFLVRAAGGMGLGTNSPNSQLHINSVSGFDPLRVQVSGSTKLIVNSTGGVSIGANATPPTNGLFVSGTVRLGTLASAGTTALCRNSNLEIGSCSSSARYKQEIENLESSEQLIDSLRPVQYRWIDSGDADIGFVAEEVAELMPALITRNENGEIEGVRYDRLTAVLVQAMQEQRAENTQLRSELARLADKQQRFEDLAARNAALEARLASLEELLLVGRRLAGAE